MLLNANKEYYQSVGEHIGLTYLLSSAMASSLRFYTHDERLNYLNSCVDKEKLQKLFNCNSLESKFLVPVEGEIFLQITQILHKSLISDIVDVEELKQIRKKYFVEKDEDFYFFPVLLATATAFSVFLTTQKPSERLNTIRKNFTEFIPAFFKLKDRSLFACLLDSLIYLFESGYACESYVTNIKKYAEIHSVTEGFCAALDYLEENARTLGFVYLSPDFFKSYDLSYKEYIFIISLMTLLKANSYERDSKRPKKYLHDLTQVDQVYLIDLFTLYCTLTVFSEHLYSVTYKSIVNDLPQLKAIENKIYAYVNQ